ncbi:hypothetical protein ACWGII_14110 [Streptomyces sp. NPDC054855]
MSSNNFTSIDVFCALAVGQSAHHGTALLRDGRTAFDKSLPNGEPELGELFLRLKRKGRSWWWSASHPPSAPWR